MEQSGDLDNVAKRWPALLGGHLALAGAVSPAFGAIFGLFLTPMATSLHWSRGKLALGFSVFVLASTVATPLAGYLLDRFGGRLVSLGAAFGLPLAVLLFAFSPPHWPAYLTACVAIGIIGTTTLPITYVSILPQWFDRRLGLAMALVVSGPGTGGFVSALIASLAIAHFGWQGGWITIAAWSALLAISGRHLIPWPQVGPPRPPVDTPATADIDPELRPFSRDPRFWLITSAFMIGLLVALGVQTNVASAITDRGASAAFAGVTIAVAGIASCIARLVGGALLDWLAVRYVAGAIFASQALGCLLIAVSPTAWAAMAGTCLVNFAYGVEADMIPYVIRRRYGMNRFGRIYGVMYGIVQLGAFMGPAAVAASYDKTGSYSGAFVAMAGCSTVASLVMLIACNVPSSREMLTRRQAPPLRKAL